MNILLKTKKKEEIFLRGLLHILYLNVLPYIPCQPFEQKKPYYNLNVLIHGMFPIKFLYQNHYK